MSSPPRTDRAWWAALGGPPGRRAAAGPWGPGGFAPLALLTLVPMVVAVLRQATCLEHGWVGRQAVDRQCASPFLADLVSPGAPTAAQGVVFVAWVALAAAAVVALTWLVRTMPGHPRRDAVQVALAPVVATSVLTGPWVLVALAGTAALWCATRRAYAACAGLVVALAVVAWSGGAAGLLWGARAGDGSLWGLAARAGHPLSAPMLTATALAGGLLAVGLVVVLARSRSAAGPRFAAAPLAAVGLVGLAPVLLTAAALPAGASLLLVPLAAAAGVSRRRWLAWSAAEVTYAVAAGLTAYAQFSADRALPAGWFGVAVIARLAMIVALATAGWRLATHAPAAPVVQAPFESDKPEQQVRLRSARS